MSAPRHPDRRSPRLAVESLEDRTTPAAGFLDPTFGTGGRELIAFPKNGTFEYKSEAHDMAVQTDGKIVVVGRVPNLTTAGVDDKDMAIVRLNPDGSLDTTFGNGGRVQIAFEAGGANGNNDDVANAVAIQPDGRIVVGGQSARTGSGIDFTLVRLTTDGNLDPTFGVGGKVITDFGTLVGANKNSDDAIDRITLQPDGKIVAAGYSVFNGVAVARYNSNGSIDKSFNGTGGNAVFPGIFLQQGRAQDVVLQGNKIVVVADTGLNGDLGVARFNANGTLDGSFASGGKYQAGLNGANGGNLAVLPNGQLLVAGGGAITGTTSGDDFFLQRLNANGSLDTTFGSGGTATVGVNLTANGNDIVTDLIVQAGGKIVLTGTAASASGAEFASARFLPGGTLDPTYAVNGVGHYFMGTQDIFGNIAAFAAAPGPDGTILIAGTNSLDFAVIRLTNDSFQGGGPPTTGGGVTTPMFAVSTDGAQVEAFSNSGVGPYNPNAPLSPNVASVFPGFTGVVRTAIADVDGDGIPDFAMVTGPGAPTLFAVVSGADLSTLIVPPTFPFRGSESFSGGGFISVGSVDGSGAPDIIVTPDEGGGPRVVVFTSGGTGAPPIVRADFFGIADAGFRGGVRTAEGDINGDGLPDLVVAAGPGGGPRIAIYDGSKVLTTRDKLMSDFFAFGGAEAAALRNGVYVTVGDVDGDGFGDLIVGAGAGGGPRVQVLSGKTLTTRGAKFGLAIPIADFFVGDPNLSRGGVRVAAKNVDGDTQADLVVTSGNDQPGDVRIYQGIGVTGRAEPPILQELSVFGTDPLANGVFVG
jgi:uncharacterized delta-60 repeat protein